MWDFAVGILAKAVWDALKRCAKWIYDPRAPESVGAIDDFHDVVSDPTLWERPIEVEGTFSEYVPFVDLVDIIKKTSLDQSASATCRLGDTACMHEDCKRNHISC